MSPRDQLLVRVLSERPTRMPVLVLSGRNEEVDETPTRMAAANVVSPIVLTANGKNTAEEAANAVTVMGDNFIICTSAYHQVRAFLTFLRALERVGQERITKIWNLPVWFQKLPPEDEETKISTYQRMGDVASYEAGLEYLAWRGK